MIPHLVEFLRLAGRKLVLVLAIFLIASMLIFLAVRAVPGDPVALRLKNPNPARVAEERARLGLDQPWHIQAWRYVGLFVTGDWGRSLTSGRAVREDVAQFFPATLELGLFGLGVGVVVGVLTAVLAEVFRVQALRRLAFLLGTIGLTVPIFWIGMLFLIVGSWWLGWFPSSGRIDLGIVPPPSRTGSLILDAMVAGRGDALLSALNHLVLPGLCLSLYPAAQVCAVLQARLQDARLQSLLISLRARGLGPVRVWLRHVLRVVSGPVITVVGSNFGALLGGAVLTETVFGWPGIGRYLVGAVLDRDLYVVQNVLLLVILLVVMVVLAADLLAYLANPVTGRGEKGDGDGG